MIRHRDRGVVAECSMRGLGRMTGSPHRTAVPGCEMPTNCSSRRGAEITSPGSVRSLRGSRQIFVRPRSELQPRVRRTGYAPADSTDSQNRRFSGLDPRGRRSKDRGEGRGRCPPRDRHGGGRGGSRGWPGSGRLRPPAVTRFTAQSETRQRRDGARLPSERARDTGVLSREVPA